MAGKLGYLGNNRGLTFEMVADATNIVGMRTFLLEYPVEGIWVAASATGASPERGFAACDPGRGRCFSLGASWLFANNKDEAEIYDRRDSVRTWSPITQWYTLEASASRCVGTTFSLVGGFRYDSFSTKFTDPTQAHNVASLPIDEAELSLFSYIPYVGAEATWGLVKVGVIGLPLGAGQFAVQGD